MDQGIFKDKMDLENIRVAENIRLENPQTIQVYEIEDNNTGHNSTRCCIILVAWFIIIATLIILKTLF